MATETSTLQLAYAETSESYRDISEFLMSQTALNEGHASHTEAWRKGNTSLCRYGRIALNVAGGEIANVDDADVALKQAFDGKAAHLYQIKEAETIIGIGSIILGQKIIDNLGQSGPRANLEYYMDAVKADDLHYQAAGLLLEELLQMPPPSKKLWLRQKELKNVSMKYYRRPQEDGPNLLIRAMSGFAAVPLASVRSSRGFILYPYYSPNGGTTPVSAVLKPDVYDACYNNTAVTVYETQ